MNLDNWKPSATLETLRFRAGFLAKIRQFFNERNYLEVETPCMSHYGITDVYLSNIQSTFRNKTYFLQTSPEYHMKRLLAAGSGPIFQIARVFRDDELGRWHNPEFTMLEWYQLGVDHHDLMNEMEAFLNELLHVNGLIRKTYQQVYLEVLSVDPLTVSIEKLKQVLTFYELHEVLPPEETDRDQYLFLIMSHIIEPALSDSHLPIAIYDFPASQASLARVNGPIAHRFEVYFKGIELANGFYELTDYNAQANRFEDDLNKRREMGLGLPDIDVYLLEALKSGLPLCSGVALGIDRLIMLTLNKKSLSDVLAFDFSRA